MSLPQNFQVNPRGGHDGLGLECEVREGVIPESSSAGCHQHDSGAGLLGELVEDPLSFGQETLAVYA